MQIKSMLIKHIKKTVRKREFWFTILVYPAIAAGYFYIKNNHSFSEFAGKPHMWYFIISFVFFAYITSMLPLKSLRKS